MNTLMQGPDSCLSRRTAGGMRPRGDAYSARKEVTLASGFASAAASALTTVTWPLQLPARRFYISKILLALRPIIYLLGKSRKIFMIL